MFVTNSVRLASPPQKDLTEFLAALIEDRADKVHVNQPAFFLHQLRKALFDALAGNDAAKGGDHALAFVGERPVDEQRGGVGMGRVARSEEHTSELQSPCNFVCRLLLEKKKHQ